MHDEQKSRDEARLEAIEFLSDPGNCTDGFVLVFDTGTRFGFLAHCPPHFMAMVATQCARQALDTAPDDMRVSAAAMLVSHFKLTDWERIKLSLRVLFGRNCSDENCPANG